MKRVAETEHDLIVEVPLVVGVDPIGVEPPRAVVVALDVEHVRVAIGVGYVRDTSCATVRRIFSGLYRIWHRNALVPRTKYLLFFKLARTTLFLIAIKKTLGVRPLDSAADNPCHPRTRLLPLFSIQNTKAARILRCEPRVKGLSVRVKTLSAKCYLRRRNTNPSSRLHSKSGLTQ